MTGLLRITIPFFAAGAVAFWWAGRRVSAGVRRARWVKYATYVVIVHLVLFATIAGRTATTVLVSAIAAGGLVEVVRLRSRLAPWTAAAAVAVQLGLGAAAIRLALAAVPAFVGYLYILVAIFDGISQASGQIVGRRKLAPATSPGKTIEGFLIGSMAAIIAAIGFRHLAGVSVSHAVAIGFIASAAGLSGDLAASWVKRRAGVKDYGALLPGHGGVMDRFDSFLAVAAVLSLIAVLA